MIDVYDSGVMQCFIFVCLSDSSGIFLFITDIGFSVCSVTAFRYRIRLYRFLKIFLQDCRKILLTVITDGQINTGILLHVFPSGLHIAAHCDYQCCRIFLFRAMKHLSAFPVCNISNRAGIYDVNIRDFIKWYNSITFFL